MPPYFHRVNSPTVWKKSEQPKENDWIASFTKKSTSSWGREELAALRVVINSDDATILPLLHTNSNFADLSLNLEEDKLQNADTPFWQNFPNERQQLHHLVNGPDSDDNVYHIVRSEQVLKRSYGPSCGAVWASLNRLCTSSNDASGKDEDVNLELDPQLTDAAELDYASNGDIPSSPPSLPVRRTTRSSVTRKATTQHVSGTPSAQEHETRIREVCGPSSDPPHEPPRSSQPYVDEEERKKSTHRPEDITVKFADAFLSHVLLHLPSQQEDAISFVEFDIQKMPLKAELRDPGVKYASIDDGGLRVVIDSGTCIGRAAVLEAKRSLVAIVDGKAELPDNHFAQMVGEALAMRLAGEWAGPGDTIFVIAASRYFIRFLEVNISEEYLEQLQVPSKHQAEDAHNINVHSTPLFDLRERSHRVHAVKNIAGIGTLSLDLIS